MSDAPKALAPIKAHRLRVHELLHSEVRQLAFATSD